MHRSSRIPIVLGRKVTTPARKSRELSATLLSLPKGLPHAIAITTADVTDRKGALLVLGRGVADLQAVQGILADGGFVGQPFALAVEELLGAQVQIAKRSELHTFAVMPQRWVIERSFAWIEKCRRLWKNSERKLNTNLQFIHLAFLTLLLRRS